MEVITSEFLLPLATLFGVANVTHLSSEIAIVLGGAWFLIARHLFSSRKRFWLLQLGIVFIAVIAATLVAASLMQSDPPAIVIDEFVAVPFVFIFYTLTYLWRDTLVVFIGLLLFGAFDVLKPLPINLIEQLPGGIGIVFDDVAAAFAAAAVLCGGTWLLKRCLKSQWYN